MMNNPRKIGYARVSTDKQSCAAQIAALEQAGCVKIFVDEGVSSTVKKRPALEKAKRYLQKGDIFTVWAIDRAFRSTSEAITFLDSLMKRDIDFQSLTQSIDTRTPEGRKWFIDTASWAEYERAIISRRTKERMTYAKANGITLGRPPKLSHGRILCARRLITLKGWSLTDVAHLCRVSEMTLKRSLGR